MKYHIEYPGSPMAFAEECKGGNWCALRCLRLLWGKIVIHQHSLIIRSVSVGASWSLNGNSHKQEIKTNSFNLIPFFTHKKFIKRWLCSNNNGVFENHRNIFNFNMFCTLMYYKNTVYNHQYHILFAVSKKETIKPIRYNTFLF